MEYEWDDLSFEEKLFCNQVDYAFAINDTELLDKLKKEDPDLFSYAMKLIENY